ncbi:hypothetical protein O6H91_09G059500 [Diphasiastrum complanatum]|nr:hypothetical protein O6H91_09G059500 [Diphasiastrum complanatum]
MGNQGEGRAINWAHPMNPTHLPPKAPSTIMDSGYNSLLMGLTNQSVTYKQQHQRTPSASFIPQITPSWIDDMLESPESPTRKGSHRRSTSDSGAVLDPSGNSTATENAREAKPDKSIGQSLHFDRLDEEQLLSMFDDVEPFQKQRGHAAGIFNRMAAASDSMPNAALDNWMVDKGNPTAASENPSTPSDSNSVNEVSNDDLKAGGLGAVKSDSEVQSVSESDGSFQTKGDPVAAASIMELDTTMDPKRAKRILANRQSAQRSRVRKLQYIAELERSVNALQIEVSALTPQVAYLDHQRVILNMDNNTLKQSIAALIQDKRFKDAHNEALKKEVQRLRLTLQQHQQQQFSKLGLGLPADAEVRSLSDAFDGFLEGDNDLSNESGIAAVEGNSLSPTKSVMAPNYLIAGNGKPAEGRSMLEESGQFPTDFSVQNPWSYTN